MFTVCTIIVAYCAHNDFWDNTSGDDGHLDVVIYILYINIVFIISNKDEATNL